MFILVEFTYFRIGSGVGIEVPVCGVIPFGIWQIREKSANVNGGEKNEETLRN